MNTYEIYTHPLRGSAAVKRGFSWPGFLFNWIWALVKRVWIAGLVLTLAAAAIGHLFFELRQSNLLFVLAVKLVYCAIAGFRGNTWLAASIEARGYSFRGIVPARTPAEALAKVATVGNEWPADWSQSPPPLWFTLVPREWQQVVAVAGLTYRAAWRFKLVPVLTTLLLTIVIGLPLLVKTDGSARGLTQIIITYSLSLITFILGMATLWLACGTLAKDVEDCQMQVVAVKPVPRWQIWLGKWSGIMLLNALLLTLAGVSVYGLIQVRASNLPEAQRKILREELLVARGSAREEKIDVEKDVETILSEKTKGQDLTVLDLEAMRKELREMLKAEFQIVLPAYRRRWTLETGMPASALMGQPLHIRIKFNSSRMHGSPQPYPTAWEVGPPESNARQRILKTLTTDTFHEIAIEPRQLTPDGKLIVDYINANDIPMVMVPENCMELLYREGGFGVNLLRGLLIIFFWLGLLAALGLAAASCLSFPVAAFVALTVLTIGLSTGTIATVVSEGSLMGGNVARISGDINLLDRIFLPILGGMLNVVNLVLDFSPIDALSTGRSVPWKQVGLAFAQIWLLVGGVVSAAGITFFTRRELATAQSQQ